MGALILRGDIIRPMKKLWLEATTFYKFGTTYRSWLFHIDVGKASIVF